MKINKQHVYCTSSCYNLSLQVITNIKNRLQPLYNTVRYNTVLDITRFKEGFQKCIDHIDKMTISGHFSL